MKFGLVGVDGKNEVGFPGLNVVGMPALGVEGIGGYDRVLQVLDHLQQWPEIGDLVVPFRDVLLHQDDPGSLVSAGEQGRGP